MKIFAMNRTGKLVMVMDVAGMDEAVESAKRWNTEDGGHSDPTMHIDIVQNARDAREATKVRAVYTVTRTNQGELFA